MKQIFLIVILNLLCIQNFVKAEPLNEGNIPELETESKLNSIIGEYNLLVYKVKTSLNKENKLMLTLPIISETIENTNNILLNFNSKIHTKVFPYKGVFELVQIKDSIYMIKNSNGFSIEVTKVNSQISKDLIFRDSNFEIINQRKLNHLIAFYEKINSQIIEENNRARLKSVEANMYGFQVLLETYALNFDGSYPDTINVLEKNAREKGYWNELKNPYFFKKINQEKEITIIDLKQYKAFPVSSKYNGLVVYEPLDCQYNNELKQKVCNSYRIYGTDDKGEFLKLEGKVLSLKNE